MGSSTSTSFRPTRSLRSAWRCTSTFITQHLIGEFVDHLSHIPCTFHLFVSVISQEHKSLADIHFSKLKNIGTLDVRVVENRGRDLSHFFCEFRDELRKFDIVAHLHTKKSLYNSGATSGWRSYLLQSLLPNGDGISRILGHLNNKSFGIIFPQASHELPYVANTWLANYSLAHAWAPRLGLASIPTGYFDFPAGSMFWARREALEPIFAANLKLSDFPSESGQTDGTFAHCLERMLGVVPQSLGYKLGILGDKSAPCWSKWRFSQYFGDGRKTAFDEFLRSATIRLFIIDIFDTLLIRPLADPDAIKDIVAAKVAEIGPPNFRQIRHDAEAKARQLKGRDVDIHDVYAQLAAECSLSKEDLAEIEEIELATERNSVSARPDAASSFLAILKSGKRVALASDMFLPRSAIETMLKDNGISGWGELYVSSDIGLRKDTGELYDHVLKAEKLAPHQVVVIGDNERSDFQIPCDKGLRALHVLKPINISQSVPRQSALVERAIQSGDVSSKFLYGILAKQNYGRMFQRDVDHRSLFGADPWTIGFCVLGPILASFSDWLRDAAKAQDIDTLFFLSREGESIKEAFDIWNRRRPAPKTVYLILSRRAVTVPAIKTFADIRHIAASNNYYRASINDFLLERYGFALEEHDIELARNTGAWPRSNRIQMLDGDISQVEKLLEHLPLECSTKRGSKSPLCKPTWGKAASQRQPSGGRRHRLQRHHSRHAEHAGAQTDPWVLFCDQSRSHERGQPTQRPRGRMLRTELRRQSSIPGSP